jgi:hypothetical protein
MHRAILIANNDLIEECDNDECLQVTWDATTLFENNTINKNVLFCNYTTSTAEIIAG